jgi:hypothetical protein
LSHGRAHTPQQWPRISSHGSKQVADARYFSGREHQGARCGAGEFLMRRHPALPSWLCLWVLSKSSGRFRPAVVLPRGAVAIRRVLPFRRAPTLVHRAQYWPRVRFRFEGQRLRKQRTENTIAGQWFQPPSSTGRQAGDPARLAVIFFRVAKGAMAELPEKNGSSTHDTGGNPFPKNHPLHQAGAEIALWVKEQEALFTSDMLKKMPPDGAANQEFLAWHLGSIAGLFDIWARALSTFCPRNDEGARAFEGVLDKIVSFVVTQANNSPLSFIPKPLFLKEVEIRAGERKQHWTGQMLLSVRKAKESQRTPRDFVGAAETKPEESGGADARPANGSEAVSQTLTSKPSTPTPREGRMVQEQPKQDAPERIDDGSPPTGTVPVPEQPQRIAAIPGPAAEAHTLVPPRPCEQHDEVPGRQATPTKNRPVEAEAHITLKKAATGTAVAPEDDAAKELGSDLGSARLSG